jgi:pyruvate kinase
MTDIWVTVGPAFDREGVAEAIVHAGVTHYRFPLAKASVKDHGARLQILRAIAGGAGRHIFGYLDLPGQRPRLTNENPIPIRKSEEFLIMSGKTVPSHLGILPWPSLWHDLPASSAIIGDGDNIFDIASIDDSRIFGRFVRDGTLERQRSFTIPGLGHLACVVTPDETMAAVQARAFGFDGIILSFVSSGTDVDHARQVLKSEAAWDPQIVAKIETKAGVDAVSEIAAAGDFIMVGRGDLQLQVDSRQLLQAVKHVIERCRSSQTYVVVATGFLESLDRRALPTASEASDIAHMVELGADALLLTVETAIYPDPLASVIALARIIDPYP